MDKTVVIDCFYNGEQRYKNNYTVVAIDVIRATTSAITSVNLGQQCFPVSTIEKASSFAKKLKNPLLAGELGGNMPDGFHLQNSPTQIETRNDFHRPLILLSTSGTRLMNEFKHAEAIYVACLRNYGAIISHMVANHSRIALIGAGTRGEFREEDQLCCAWIAEGLQHNGYKSEDENTQEIINRWHGASVNEINSGKSAEYLRRSGQVKDLEFVLEHINDLSYVYKLENGQIVQLAVT